MGNDDIRQEPTPKQITAYVGLGISYAGLLVWEFGFHYLTEKYWFVSLAIATMLVVFGADSIREGVRWLRLRRANEKQRSVLQARAEDFAERERRLVMQELESHYQKGKVEKDTFKYLVQKIKMLLDQNKTKGNLTPARIICLSPFDDSTVAEMNEMANLAHNYGLQFEWGITEKTINRGEFHKEILKFLEANRNTFLTGELPVFDKLLVLPQMVIVGFIKDVWFLWNLSDSNFEVDEIKEKIVLTPFERKITQFFGRDNVHKSISCHLSEMVNSNGFMLGGEYSYLWLTDQREMFAAFTNYQKNINSAFRDASHELVGMSSHITANLPLLENYKAIINDPGVEQWFSKLRAEVNERLGAIKKRKGETKPLLYVDRYIYVQGKLENGHWQIEPGYRQQVIAFLQKPFFTGMPSYINGDNEEELYKTWIVLIDVRKLLEEYGTFKGATYPKFPYDDVISNWIWFECMGNYHVLQYEMGMPVEREVAELIAGKRKKDVEEFAKISAYMFADASDPNSQAIMKKYDDYKRFLERCQGSRIMKRYDAFIREFSRIT